MSNAFIIATPAGYPELTVSLVTERGFSVHMMSEQEALMAGFQMGLYQGKDGEDGTDGLNGASAYEIAKAYGFEGTEEEWLASLKDEPGPAGPPGDSTAVSYADIADKPQINNVELAGNKTLDQLGIQAINTSPTQTISNSDIEELLNSFTG